MIEQILIAFLGLRVGETLKISSLTHDERIMTKIEKQMKERIPQECFEIDAKEMTITRLA